jgi:hypothetical protein
MMILPTRDEVIKGLAIDYAKRASVLSLKFEDAYDRYVKRCEIRSYENLLHQFNVGGLGVIATPGPSKNFKTEYIISASDDDCEDGVCKL